MVLITAFGESVAFLSLLFRGTTLLIAASAFIKTGALPYLPIMIGAIVGAVLGYSISYAIGRRRGSALARIWPFSRNPDLLPVGIGFSSGAAAKACLSAASSAHAGVILMLRARFWFANITSALVWAPMLLFVG